MAEFLLIPSRTLAPRFVGVVQAQVVAGLSLNKAAIEQLVGPLIDSLVDWLTKYMRQQTIGLCPITADILLIDWLIDVPMYYLTITVYHQLMKTNIYPVVVYTQITTDTSFFDWLIGWLVDGPADIIN